MHAIQCYKLNAPIPALSHSCTVAASVGSARTVLAPSVLGRPSCSRESVWSAGPLLLCRPDQSRPPADQSAKNRTGRPLCQIDSAKLTTVSYLSYLTLPNQSQFGHRLHNCLVSLIIPTVGQDRGCCKSAICQQYCILNANTYKHMVLANPDYSTPDLASTFQPNHLRNL
jgi:hypothetical protein